MLISYVNWIIHCIRLTTVIAIATCQGICTIVLHFRDSFYMQLISEFAFIFDTGDTVTHQTSLYHMTCSMSNTIKAMN